MLDFTSMLLDGLFAAGLVLLVYLSNIGELTSTSSRD